MMKNTYLIFALALLMSSCLTFKEVEFKGVEDFKVEKLTASEGKVRVSVNVDNPNNYKIKIKKADLDLYLGGKNVGKAKLDKKVIIPKKSESTQDVVIVADNLDLAKAIASNFMPALLSGKLNVGVKGKVKAGVFIISKKFDFDVSEKINVKDLDIFKNR